MTPEEARVRWVEALRSGDYEQGKHELHYKVNRGQRFCCLGVACTLAAADGVELHIDETFNTVRYDFQSSSLPTSVIQWLGLSGAIGSFTGSFTDGTLGGTSLAGLNDSGMSFYRIADLIESAPEGLFEGDV